jgi:hypothetical protein
MVIILTHVQAKAVTLLGRVHCRACFAIPHRPSQYAVETGQLPAATWFVVNHFRGTDPNSRQQLLPGPDEDAETFGQQGGLIIDTRDLFRLRKTVAAGTIRGQFAPC